MKGFLKHTRLAALKPWIIFIGVFLLLKVTGVGNEISYVAQSTLLKAGIMDADPDEEAPDDRTFGYDLLIRDLNGNTVDMNDLKGKVIFLNLWATWCGPCRAEMPSIQNLYNSVDRDKIAFVMLSLDQEETQGRISKYIDDKQLTLPVYLPAGPLPKQLRVSTIPTTFIIGRDGKIKTRKTGMANYDNDDMRQYLKELSGL